MSAHVLFLWLLAAIPADKVSPSYLVRAEMIALHEGDASYLKNQFRGAQFYPNCVQIEVVGDGTVELPKGVSFPGAYDYSDPGVVFDVSLHSNFPAFLVILGLGPQWALCCCPWS